MTTVTIHKAKTELSKLLARVEEGEEIVIARGSHPIAKIVPINAPTQSTRGQGAWAGLFTMPESFFDPLPEEELKAWEGEYEPPA